MKLKFCFLVALILLCCNVEAQRRAAETDVIVAGGLTARVTVTSFPDSNDYSIFVSSTTRGSLNVGSVKNNEFEEFVSAVATRFAVDTLKPMRVFVKVGSGYTEVTFTWVDGVPTMLGKPSRTSNEFKKVMKQESEP